MIAIVGPTAAGKSDLALYLAQCFPSEIIGADSRQVYRHMDIGTNKPTSDERAAVPHHVIDVIEPDEDFSLAIYHQLAVEALNTIARKGKLPLLVGGSGLYVWSLIEGWQVPRVRPDQKLRRDLEVRAEQEGSHMLHEELRDIDPIAAARTDPRNIRRIIRALEIWHGTGQPPSRLRHKVAPGFPALVIGLTRQRGELYREIDWRVDRMLQRGLVEEVEQLLSNGYGPSLPSMSGIGYRQIVQFLRGEMTLPEATDKMKYETHRLARHQYTWFRLSDSRIHWFDLSGEGDKNSAATLGRVEGVIEDFIS